MNMTRIFHRFPNLDFWAYTLHQMFHLKSIDAGEKKCLDFFGRFGDFRPFQKVEVCTKYPQRKKHTLSLEVGTPAIKKQR